MVLHHVAQRTGFLVITATVADADFFADGELDGIHRFAVPEALENGIGKAEHQNVLHGFLAQIMVDAEHLRLVRVTRQLFVERPRRFEVMAERFFHHQTLPAGAFALEQTGTMHLLDDFAELAGRNRQIKQQIIAQSGVAERGQLCTQFFIGSLIRQIAHAIMDILCKRFPDRLIHRLRARKLVECGAQFLTPQGIRLLAAGKTDHAKGRGHLLFLE